MELGLTVVFPRAVPMTEGSVVEAGGEFTYADRLVALSLTDQTLGQTYTANRDEIPEPLAYSGPRPYTLPVVGEVVSFSYYNGSTQLTVFPTNQAVYQFNALYEPLRELAVPAFWKLVAQQREFTRRAGLVFYPRIRDEQAEAGPRLYDASETVVKLFNYFARKRRFHVARSVRYLWSSLEKLLVAERHMQRLRAIDDLRHHLFTVQQGKGRDDLLRETEAEAALVVEAIAPTIYSSLDILAHVINEVYELGMSNNYANFMNVVTAKADDSRCLEREYASDPLTSFLLTQRKGWIREVEEWRHYVVHHGCLWGGNYVDNGALVAYANDQAPMNPDAIKVATDLAGAWCSSLKETLLTALGYIGNKADALAAVSDDDLPVGTYSPDLFQIRSSPALEPLLRFFELWQATDAEEPQRLDWLYYRVSKEWKKEWPWDRFCNFIRNHPITGFKLEGPITTGTNQPTRVTVTVDFSDGPRKIGFSLVQFQNSYLLTRTPYSTIPSFIQRVEITNLDRRQSGADSGYRDVVLGGRIRNASNVPLTDVTLHAFWTDLSQAQTAIGTLGPGEERDYQIVWAEACLRVGEHPPVSRELLASSRVYIRAVYNAPTHEGCYWAEDTHYQ